MLFRSGPVRGAEEDQPARGVEAVELDQQLPMFSQLDDQTRHYVQAPPFQCPPPPPGCWGVASPGSGGAGGMGSLDASADSGVVVNVKETVGPYDTVQLSSTDPTALLTWLSSNGYNVPSDMNPVITAYGLWLL